MSDALKDRVQHHLMYSICKDADHATIYDWRLAFSYAMRDRVVERWHGATRTASQAKAKRVYYLSMEFLIGRLLEDAMVNLGLRDEAVRACEDLGLSFEQVLHNEPDAALGNGGLGRLAACFMESLATLGVPAMG